MCDKFIGGLFCGNVVHGWKSSPTVIIIEITTSIISPSCLGFLLWNARNIMKIGFAGQISDIIIVIVVIGLIYLSEKSPLNCWLLTQNAIIHSTQYFLLFPIFLWLLLLFILNYRFFDWRWKTRTTTFWQIPSSFRSSPWLISFWFIWDSLRLNLFLCSKKNFIVSAIAVSYTNLFFTTPLQIIFLFLGIINCRTVAFIIHHCTKINYWNKVIN